MCGGRLFALGATVLMLSLGGLSLWATDLSADEPRLRPALPEPKGEACVEPTEVMRRRHMDFLLHHRDRTMREGVRTKKHSLVECLECHSRPNAQGEYARHTSDEHFCTACHTFSSVQIDCFSCHADRPRAFYQSRAGAADDAMSDKMSDAMSDKMRGKMSGAMSGERGGVPLNARAMAEALSALRAAPPREAMSEPTSEPATRQ